MPHFSLLNKSPKAYLSISMSISVSVSLAFWPFAYYLNLGYTENRPWFKDLNADHLWIEYGLHCLPQKSHVELLTPSTSEWDLSWSDVFTEIIKLK